MIKYKRLYQSKRLNDKIINLLFLAEIQFYNSEFKLKYLYEKAFFHILH